MVFGTTYCAISHLPIEDGDTCILIPLGFRMNYEFDEYNKADINCFSYLYTFIKPVVEVKFEGNVSMVKYASKNGRHKKGEEYEQHEMFMLIHKKFYEKLLIEFNPEYLEHIERLPLSNSTYPIWEKANEEKALIQAGLQGKLKKEEISKDEYIKQSMNTPTPTWLRNLFQVAEFMGRMGIPAHPIFCNDQHQMGERYEKMRAECLKA